MRILRSDSRAVAEVVDYATRRIEELKEQLVGLRDHDASNRTRGQIAALRALIEAVQNGEQE